MREEGGELVPTRSLEDLELPEELASAVSARVQDLDATARDLLVVAAVVGRPFSVADVGAIAGLPRRRSQARCRPRWNARSSSASTTTSRSPTRCLPACCGRQPHRRRQEIHVAAARAFAASATVEQDQILTIAWHIAEAGTAADAGEASAICRAAGERAWQLAAWAESANYFDAAVAAARRGNEPAADVAELLTRAGAAHCRNLDPGPGRARLHEAVELFTAHGSNVGAVRCLAELVHAQVVWGSFGQHIDTGQLERLLPEIEEEDVVLCARATRNSPRQRGRN